MKINAELFSKKNENIYMYENKNVSVMYSSSGQVSWLGLDLDEIKQNLKNKMNFKYDVGRWGGSATVVKILPYQYW